MRKGYLFLATVGFAAPYYFLVSFALAYGLDLPLLVEQLFANDISTFFAIDLIISAAVFWIFLYREAQRLHMKLWWVYIVATLLVGPSFAWPLFLYFRVSRLEALEAASQNIHVGQRARRP
jgi:hypothetical protein